MKKTIKILALALAVLAAISCFAGCGKKKSDKLVVGITEFEPMDYKDKDGKWIGFDAEIATAQSTACGTA